MKHTIFILLIGLFALTVVSCQQSATTTASTTTTTTTQPKDQGIHKTVSPAEFKQLMDEGKMTVIDIRRPKERYDDNINEDTGQPYGYIPGTQLNIDWKASNFKDEIQKLDKSKPYGIYCRTGHRSGLALKVMKDLGFKEVYNLGGGMKAWIKDGLPTEVVPKPAG